MYGPRRLGDESYEESALALLTQEQSVDVREMRGRDILGVIPRAENARRIGRRFEPHGAGSGLSAVLGRVPGQSYSQARHTQ